MKNEADYKPHPPLNPELKQSPGKGSRKVGEFSKLLLRQEELDLGSQYELLTTIREGASTSLYKVHDRCIDKILAVKVFHTLAGQDPLAWHKFEQAAKSLISLTHPNLVTVFGFGKTKRGEPYLLIDFIKGFSLAQINPSSLDTELMLNAFIQVCEALQFMHQRGILHGRLQPADILLNLSSSGAVIVKLINTSAANKATQNGTAGDQSFYDPLYMSPESCQGSRIDPRADVYSLGCIMYEMWSGTPPFTSENNLQIMVRHVTERPASLALCPRVQQVGGLQQTIERCLAKDPRDRYQSIGELLKALENLQRPPKQRYRSARVMSAVAAAGAVSVFLFICLWTYLAPTRSPLDSAPTQPRFSVSFDKQHYNLYENASIVVRTDKSCRLFLFLSPSNSARLLRVKISEPTMEPGSEMTIGQTTDGCKFLVDNKAGGKLVAVRVLTTGPAGDALAKAVDSLNDVTIYSLLSSLRKLDTKNQGLIEFTLVDTPVSQ